jgi:hypothetical protein
LGRRNSLYGRRDWARRLHHRGGYNRSCAQICEAVDGDVVYVVGDIGDVPHAGDVYVADVGFTGVVPWKERLVRRQRYPADGIPTETDANTNAHTTAAETE